MRALAHGIFIPHAAIYITPIIMSISGVAGKVNRANKSLRIS